MIRIECCVALQNGNSLEMNQFYYVVISEKKQSYKSKVVSSDVII